MIPLITPAVLCFQAVRLNVPQFIIHLHLPVSVHSEENSAMPPAPCSCSIVAPQGVCKWFLE